MSSNQHSELLAQVRVALERAGISYSAVGWTSPGGYCPHCQMADGAHLPDECEIALALTGLDSLEEQLERQATNIGALYRQRRDAELACELSREENKRLLEQLETAQRILVEERRWRQELYDAGEYVVDGWDIKHADDAHLDNAIEKLRAVLNPASEQEAS